jgi:hypothetical protein
MASSNAPHVPWQTGLYQRLKSPAYASAYLKAVAQDEPGAFGEAVIHVVRANKDTTPYIGHLIVPIFFSHFDVPAFQKVRNFFRKEMAHINGYDGLSKTLATVIRRMKRGERMAGIENYFVIDGEHVPAAALDPRLAQNDLAAEFEPETAPDATVPDAAAWKRALSAA